MVTFPSVPAFLTSVQRSFFFQTKKHNSPFSDHKWVFLVVQQDQKSCEGLHLKQGHRAYNNILVIDLIKRPQNPTPLNIHLAPHTFIMFYSTFIFEFLSPVLQQKTCPQVINTTRCVLPPTSWRNNTPNNSLTLFAVNATTFPGKSRLISCRDYNEEIDISFLL